MIFVICECGAIPWSSKLPEAFETKTSCYWRMELSLLEKRVSGLSAVSVVSAALRFARGEAFLMSPALRALLLGSGH